MDQVISNIQVLLQLPIAIKSEELASIQNGSYEDIHHALYQIQDRLPPGIQLNIDNLTADAAHIYPGAPIDGQEQFEAEQKQELENPDVSGAIGGLASLGLAMKKTSKEVELAQGYEVEKKDNVNKAIDEITKTNDVALKQQKVRELLDSLQREKLFEHRKDDLVKKLQDANPKSGKEVAAKVQDRFNSLQNKRENPGEGKLKKTASDDAYQKYLDRMVAKIPNMTDKELSSFLKRYTNRQLQATRVDFQKLMFEDERVRFRFKFLGFKYEWKTQKKIVSVRDQNKITKQQRKDNKPILQKWADERKKARAEALRLYKEQKAAEVAKLGRLRYWLNQMGFRRRKPVQQETVTFTTEQPDTSGDNGPSFDPIGTANQIYGNIQRLKNIPNWVKGIFGNGGATSGAGVGSTVTSASSAGAGGAGGPIAAFFASPAGWITIIVLIIIIIIVVLLIVIFGKGGNGTTTIVPGQIQCPSSNPSTAQMITVLEQQFNIAINGTDANVIGDVYSTVCTLSQYTFVQLLHVPQVKIDINLDVPDKYHSACSGHTAQENGTYKIDIYGACSSSPGNEFVITHELAHVIQFENADLVSQFCSQVYHGSLQTGHCVSSHPNSIPTYNCLRDYTPNVDTPNPAECFSDMAGSFLTYKDFHDTVVNNGHTIPNNWQLMNDYPGNFPVYYNFALLNLFSANTATGNASQLVSIAQQITQNLGKTFGRAIDEYDQIVPNPPGHFQLQNSPSPNYVVAMRSGSACIVVNGVKKCVNSRYWCTDLLIDTYNITLGKRVLGEDLGTVQDMIYFWKNPPSSSFVFVHYRLAGEHQSALLKLYGSKPTFGDALFFESKEGDHNGFEHVALIRDMNLDSNGNGKILTYEANNNSTTGTYPIYNWQIRNTPYPVTGFGLYTGIPGGGAVGGF